MIRNLWLAGLALALSSTQADAHGFRVEVAIQGGLLRVVAAYDTGEAADGAAVTLATPDGRIVADGLADADGVWTGPVLPPGEYRVRADDGFGHAGHLTIVIDGQGELPPARSPWPRGVKIGIGLGIIAGLTLALLGWSRARARVAGASPARGQLPGDSPAGPRPPSAPAAD